MKTTAFNEEVLFAADAIVQIDASDILELKKMASQNPRKRIRICVHKDTKDHIHEMLIVHNKDYYVRPHKHIDRIESMFVLEGEVDYIIFDDIGNIKKILKMGDQYSGKIFYNKLDKPYYHMLIIRSNFLVFHEITTGPFAKNKTIFPDWAPKEYKSDFKEKINNLISKFEK